MNFPIQFICSYDENRNRLKTTLFSIHRSVASILEVWSLKYSNKTLVNIEELSKVEEPFTLFNFIVSCSSTENSIC